MARINTDQIASQFMATLGESSPVRRYDEDTDSFTSSVENLVIEPQDITYRPLNRYKTSVIGTPVPIQRLKVFSLQAFESFRDEITWRGDRFRVIETSQENELLMGIYEAKFIRGTKGSEAL